MVKVMSQDYKSKTKVNIIDEFIEVAKKTGLNISKENLKIAIQDPETAGISSSDFADVISLFIEKEAREKSGLEKLRVRVYSYGLNDESAIIIASIPIKIGRKEKEVDIYTSEIMKGSFVTDSVEKFEKILKGTSNEIAKEAKKIVEHAEKMNKIYRVIRWGHDENDKLVMIKFKFPDKKKEEYAPAIAPNWLNEGKAKRLVNYFVREELKGKYKPIDIYKILNNKLKVRFLPALEIIQVEPPPSKNE